VYCTAGKISSVFEKELGTFINFLKIIIIKLYTIIKNVVWKGS